MEQKIRRDRNMGSNLRRLRDQYGISQEKLCAELQRRGCDIGRTAYAKYESGELNIRASVLIELRKIYSCSYDEFFAGLDRNIESGIGVFTGIYTRIRELFWIFIGVTLVKVGNRRLMR